MSVEEWTSILKLAYEWNFTEVKELALRGLESIQIPAIQKIVLYQTYKVDRSRLRAAYTALTVRDEAITTDEGREIGPETALQPADVDSRALTDRVLQLPSAGAASGDTIQIPPSGSSTNARDTTQTQSTQTNSGSPSSSPPSGTGPIPMGPPTTANQMTT